MYGIRKPITKVVRGDIIDLFDEEKKPERKSGKENKLPPDTYPELTESKRILVRQADNFRQYLDVSVKRFENDEENPMMVHIAMYQESERYTGFLKGKSVYLPIESLADLVDTLSDVCEEIEELL